MSTFTLNSITVKGLNVIAKLIAGSTLEFTRIAIGDGAMPSGKTPLTVTDLSHRLFDVPIDSVTSGGNGEATVTGIFSNDDCDTGFFYRELGLFAKDPASGAEILYCYGNAAADAEWISPSGASSLIEKKVKIVTLVGNAETVKAQIASGLYETKENVAKIASMKADLDTTATNGGRLLASQMRLDQEQTLYVDSAAATGGDGSEAKPFKTIQAAINARYLGAPVIYIKIKAGTYSEDIKTPRAPNTTWRLMKNGTGVVTINTAIIDNCNYVVFDSLTFKGGAVANSTIIYIANTASANFNNVTVNGNANLTGIHFTTSRGVLNNTQLNNCGLAIASTEGACINLRNTSGTGNIRGVHADGAFVMCSDHTIQANTPFSRINGGGITAEGGDSSIPSNFAQLYNLGDFATVDALKTKLLSIFGQLAQYETKNCAFESSITSGFGDFKTPQKVKCIISKLSNANNGYGLITFYAYDTTAISTIKIIDGIFVGEPKSLSSVKTVNNKQPDENGNIEILLYDFATQEEAEAGTNNDKIMTPLRVKQAMGTMTFIDLLPVGWVSYKEFLLPQHVKANGATVNRRDYPSLAAYATEHNLWTDDPASEPYKYGRGDGSTTMVLPDYRNRVIQGGDNIAVKAPGLPNITGSYNEYPSSPTEVEGAFTGSNRLTNACWQERGSGQGAGLITFDASNSNTIYGASDTVQPAAFSLLPQIKF